LFSVLSLSLIATGTIYFFYSGKEYIKKQVALELQLYSDLFNEKTNELIINSLMEINGLSARISIIDKNKLRFGNQERILNEVNNFVLHNSEAYEKISIKGFGFNDIIDIRPVKVFSGEFVVKTEVLEESGKLMDLEFSRLLPNGFIRSKLNSREQKIFLLSQIDSSGNFICAQLFCNNFLDRVNYAINIPLNINTYLVDSAGYVFYSRQSSAIKKQLNEFTNLKNYFPSYLEKALHGNDNNSYIIKYLDDIDSYLVVSNDYTSTLAGFNSFIAKGLLISFLLVIAILGIVYFTANKISSTVDIIASIAGDVSKGNFSRKIHIKREDELGYLIDSFNNMVDKLDASYNQLNELNKELEIKINELILTKEKLTENQKLALIGETVSKISHEIQNKISGVSIWVQNLELKLKQNEVAQIYIEEMKSALSNFMEMLINFKKFYRKPTLNRSDFYVSQLIKTIIQKLKYELEYKKIEIDILLENDEKMLNADKELFEQMLTNVLINAIHFSPENEKVQIAITTNIDLIRIKIIDQGEGIQEDNIPHVFEPFFTTKHSGSGLGLAIAKNIVNVHSGNITVVNMSYGGTCFIIELPKNHMPYTY